MCQLEASKHKLQKIEYTEEQQYTTSAAIQGSLKGDMLVEDVDLNGKYIRLNNMSTKVMFVCGWECTSDCIALIKSRWTIQT